MPNVADEHRNRELRRVGTQAVVVLTAVLVYFASRHLTEGSPRAALDHARDVFALEQRLGLDWEHWAQETAGAAGPVATFANWVYIWGHWPVIVLAMLWLVRREPSAFCRLRDAMVVSGGIGVVVFAAYPVAPPRLAQMGLVDTIAASSQSYRALQPPAFTNQYAAMPSLHVGWDLLVGIVVFMAVTAPWLRVLAVVMPLLMAGAVVVTANHFVLDVILGAALGLTGLAAALLAERRRERVKAAPIPSQRNEPPRVQVTLPDRVP